MNIPLSELKNGEGGIITEISGGGRLITKLQNLGIIQGKKILKISGQFMRGPITVRIGSTTVAIGFGMAQKIILEVDKK